MITLHGAIDKNEWLDGNIIISYFGGSNNIFADCTYCSEDGSGSECKLNNLNFNDQTFNNYGDIQIFISPILR